MKAPEPTDEHRPTLNEAEASELAGASETLLLAESPGAETSPTHLPRGSTLGRYLVLEELGVGGMGVVYSAYDPELDRRIAIKLLLPSRADGVGGRARLAREAQALARLSHPNVVNVHDVGEVDGKVFVAMELVEGVTLRQWLGKERRSQREILEVFRQAGRGLSAAHVAGVVHRDFKPDNVLVGVDGRARVADFGLARGRTPSGTDSGDARERSGGSQSWLDGDLTEAGMVMGTPAYMSPEQHTGRATDAATDQFAFCVSLYAALYGQRPFTGDDLITLADAVCTGEIRPAPPGSDVPAWLRRVLVKGLSVRPEERYATMDALLGELARDPAALRHRWLMLGGALVVAIAATAGAYATGARDRTPPCATAGDPIALSWTPARREAIAAAFARTGLAYASESHERVTTIVDEYVAEWRSGANEACEATHVTNTQSGDLLDRRMACLDLRRARLEALLEVYAQADASVVERAVAAALGLPGVASCADREALGLAVAPPRSAAQQAEVDALAEELQRIGAIHSAGHYQEALLRREAAVARAKEIGYPPLIAEAVHDLANTQSALGMPDTEASIRRAFNLALEAGDARVASLAAADLAQKLGVEEHAREEGLQWVEVAESLARFRGGDATIESMTLNVRAVTAVREGRREDARRAWESQLERMRDEDPNDRNIAVALMNLGVLHVEQRKLAEARSLLAQAVAHAELTEGPRHPSTLDLKAKLAAVAMMDHDYENAERELRAVLALQRESYGERHPEVAYTIGALGITMRHLGELEEAERLQREALDQRRELLGPDDPRIAESLRNISLVRADLGDHVGALDLARQALANDERILDPNDPTLSIDRMEVATHLIALERWSEARVLVEAARVSFSRPGADPLRLGEVLIETGRIERGSGDEERALESFEAALERAESIDEDRLRAWASLEVATSLDRLGREPARVRALAERARELMPAPRASRSTVVRRAGELLDE